jgi:hypothetical protein
MDMELRIRNNDRGFFSPTFQERINSTLPVAESPANIGVAQTNCAAPALTGERTPTTPHFLNNSEVQATLSRIEEEAHQQSMEIVALHSGLNELRVARLLGLLE